MYPFMPWLPDLAALSSDAAMSAMGVIPTARGYRPQRGFAPTSSAITARAQGAASFRDVAGNIHNFCGDATKLYKQASDGLSWDDISRTVGGAYATPSEGWWHFWRFGNFIFAANGIDALQSYDMASSTNFEDAAGSPPVAFFGITIRDFAVALRVAGAHNRVHWSGLADPTTWVASALTLSDTQDLSDGGAIMGGVGGEFGIIVQERGIQRCSFEGPPTAFRFDKIATDLGCRAERSIAGYSDLMFWLADEGPHMMRGGVEIVDIGAEKWSRFLETDIDSNYLYRISSAVDPINKTWEMGYASTSGGGSPDSKFTYHIPTGKASLTRVNHEIIFSGATQSGYTLDGLDSISGSIDALMSSLDSRLWTGSGRLILGAFNTSHQSGFFAGNNVEATIETGDAQLTPGRKSLVRSLRPIVQGSSVTPSAVIRSRNNLHEALTDSSPVSINANGICPFRVNARYHRAQVTVPASSTWDHAIGIEDIKLSAMGARG